MRHSRATHVSGSRPAVALLAALLLAYLSEGCDAARAPGASAVREAAPLAGTAVTASLASTPASAVAPSAQLQLFAGPSGTCAIAGPGQVRCWGNIPVEFEKLAADIRAVSLELRGNFLACALNEARTAHCLKFPFWQPLEPYEPVHDVQRILPFERATLAVLHDGSVCAMGKRTECGAVEFMVDGARLPPTQAPDLRRALWANGNIAFADHTRCSFPYAEARPFKFECRHATVQAPPLKPVAGDWTAFVDARGQLWHELGLQHRDVDAPMHEPLQGFGAVVGVSVTYHQICAHRAQGPTLCMPRTSPKGAPNPSPSALPGLECTAGLVAGNSHHCARTCAGEILCWGDNSEKQLELRAAAGTTTTSSQLPLSNVHSITAGDNYTCALDGEGAVRCWGSGYSFESEPAGTITASPTRVTLPEPASSIVAWQGHTCALLQSGAVSCWGDRAGANKRGVPFSAPAGPTQVRGLEQATSLAVGGDWGCAITAGGRVECWGANGEGQLLSPEPRPSAAVQVPGLDEVVAMDIEGHAACALRKDGAWWCWGASPELAVPVSPDGAKPGAAARPKQMGKLRGAQHIVWGSGLCMNTTQGTVWCTKKLAEPLEQMTRDVKRLLAGHPSRIVALHDDGTLQELLGWPQRLQPALAASGVVDLALGSHHQCVLGSDGHVRCVGNDQYGQLGNGKLLSATRPLAVTPFASSPTKAAP